jgi:hypothetical protein
MMIVVFLPQGGIMIIDLYGRIDVSNGAGTQTILRPGYAVQVNSFNEPIGEPFLVPPGLLAQIMAQLTSRPGQKGGAINLPTDLMASRFGMGQTNLPNNPANTPGPGTLSIFNRGDVLTTNRSQQQQANDSFVPPPPPSRPPSDGDYSCDGSCN